MRTLRLAKCSPKRFFYQATQSTANFLSQPLNENDPEVYKIIKSEALRQLQGINLIASENHCSQAVLDGLRTSFVFKYSDGKPGNRYHGGNQVVDKMELLTQKRALEAFRLDPSKWSCNPQAYSGAQANFYVYAGLMYPHDRILSLDLPHGGHLSHGYQTRTKKISAVSKYYEVLPYRLNEVTEICLNIRKQMEELANSYSPKIIIAGASAYSRLIDYERMRKICDSVGALMLADMAHISGLIASGVIPSPFDFADIVTTTTHKQLRGPRGALIFYRIGEKSINQKTGEKQYYDLKERIDLAVYPGMQAGPMNNTICAIGIALREAQSPEFKQYSIQLIKNSKVLAQALLDRNFTLVSGGTDNHIVLLDMRSKGLDGSRMEIVMELCNIYANKNTVPGDKSALVPSGLRLGTPAMTTRGMVESDFNFVADAIDRCTVLTQKIKKESGPKIVDFKKWVNENKGENSEISQIKKEVMQFSNQFGVPGTDEFV